MNVALKLLTAERTVIKRTRQTKTIIDQHLLTCSVTIVHALDLPHSHVTLVNHDKKIIWEEIKKCKRWLSLTTTIHVTRIVLNAVGVAHFSQHFNVVFCSLANTLRFNKLTLFFKESDLLFHFLLNLTDGDFHMLVISHKVGGRKDNQMVNIRNHTSCQGLNLTDTINLITEKLYPKGMLVTASWKELNHITTHTKTPTLKVDVIALKLNVHKVIEQLVP